MALSLYVTTFQVVLRANSADKDSWSRIYGSLSCLRQALLCSGCRKLPLIPQHPTNSKCQHNYCRRCVGGRKPHCEWCKHSPDFEENVRLRIILQCYKKMCRYIMSSAICSSFDHSKLTSPMFRFISMVYEGAGLRDIYHRSGIPANGPLRKKPRLNPKSNSENENTQPVNGQTPLYSIKLNDMKSAKVMLKKTSITDDMLAAYSASDASSDDSEIDCPKIIAECLKSVRKRKSCRCGIATQSPGNLTCCGQRCPCYVNGRACINCCCRGCRNPQKNVIASPPYHSNHPDNNESDEAYNVFNDESDDSSDEGSYSDSGRDPSE